jgi:CDP-diacylglycerol--serine O-phosphatidyltransferase
MSIVSSSNGETIQACLFILYSGFFDVFDGIVARITRTSSRFGVELDSLADVVSFGAAPSFILYKAYFYSNGGLGVAIASLIMIFAALRLARFNTQLSGFDKSHFSGIPAPISALTVSSFFLFYFDKNFDHYTSVIFTYVIALILPLLMVSKLKYDTIPKFSIRAIKSQLVKSIVILIIILLIAVTKGEGLFAFCLFYISTGLFRGIRNQFRRIFFSKKTGADETDESLKLKSSN